MPSKPYTTQFHDYSFKLHSSKLADTCEKKIIPRVMKTHFTQVAVVVFALLLVTTATLETPSAGSTISVNATDAATNAVVATTPVPPALNSTAPVESNVSSSVVVAAPANTPNITSRLPSVDINLKDQPTNVASSVPINDVNVEQPQAAEEEEGVNVQASLPELSALPSSSSEQEVHEQTVDVQKTAEQVLQPPPPPQQTLPALPPPPTLPILPPPPPPPAQHSNVAINIST